jgi:hypothetical protein
MKIDVKELRKIVREVLVEEMDSTSDRPTVPAAKSAGEQQFKKDIAGNKWGNPKAIPKSGDTKNARVWNVVVQSMGSQMNDQQRQALRQELDAFLQSKDPSEKLIATAEELANEFSQSKKSA